MADLDPVSAGDVEGLRSLSYQVFAWFGLVFSFVAIFPGSSLAVDRPDWAAGVPYVLGIAFLIGYLAIMSLPTAVIAWTMADD